MVTEFDIPPSQQRILAIAPRICASISIVCALIMAAAIMLSTYRRRRIYHRLMLGCVPSIIILNIAQLWGQAAAPEGTDHVLGARGNAGTCTAQGFMYQFRLVVPSYYAVLSLMTYRLIKSKFKHSLGQTEEYLVHIGVYVFPIASGIYLTAIEGFNMITQGCGIANAPLACGGDPEDEGYVPCTRGPENIGLYQWLFAGLPSVIIMLGPTIVMGWICCRLRKQSVLKSFIYQSCLYLLAVYWTYLFRWIDAAILLSAGEYVFATAFVADIMDPLQGLWTLIIYSYFRTHDPKTAADPTSSNEGSAPFGDTGGSGSGSSGSRSFRPEFSIFDGSVANRTSDSPWAKFLTDDFEDPEYMKDCGEYSDGDFKTTPLEMSGNIRDSNASSDERCMKV